MANNGAHYSWYLLRFIDQIQEQIDGVEEEAGIVKDLYDLVEQYQVPVNPEDMAIYQVHIIVVVFVCKIMVYIFVVESSPRSNATESSCG